MSIWKTNDTLIAKGSKAKVISSDISSGKNWVKVLYSGQEYEGYQSDFEAKGWKKLDLATTAGCGCLVLLGLVLFLGVIVGLGDNTPKERTFSDVLASPNSEAEKYWGIIVINTDGLIAQETIQNHEPEKLYANHGNVCAVIASGRELGLTLDQIKERLADEIQVNQGHDSKLAINLADGMIDGALAWGCQ
jgi:hypothetical protein